MQVTGLRKRKQHLTINHGLRERRQAQVPWPQHRHPYVSAARGWQPLPGLRTNPNKYLYRNVRRKAWARRTSHVSTTRRPPLSGDCDFF
ncbi:hypothetical protein NDU88_004685 [Pleurodeles waltl]|uniref:Uncharacterized protein n=1 Tax=Pleurodeles waltl TaxID=8319 RepID=A0AAV7WWE3_PLEWA|nr:hypothetical protein NDU88_004685 [Pleurodeles waltl]